MIDCNSAHKELGWRACDSLHPNWMLGKKDGAFGKRTGKGRLTGLSLARTAADGGTRRSTLLLMSVFEKRRDLCRVAWAQCYRW